MRTYEVIGYKTVLDYRNRIQNMSEEGLTVKRKALKLGKRYLDEFAVVKVQSNDREFIQVLERYSVDYFIKKFQVIPAKEIGVGDLALRHCALWHCGVTVHLGSYAVTEEASALILLFGGRYLDECRAVYRVNDGNGEEYVMKNITPEQRDKHAKKRILDKLKQIKSGK